MIIMVGFTSDHTTERNHPVVCTALEPEGHGGRDLENAWDFDSIVFDAGRVQHGDDTARQFVGDVAVKPGLDDEYPLIGSHIWDSEFSIFRYRAFLDDAQAISFEADDGMFGI